MIYMAVALGIEAKPIINYCNLKRDNSIKKLQVFKNEEITLIITGVGVLKSAIAITHILSKVEIDENDIFVNIGVTGAKDRSLKLGDIIFCNKIINSETKRNYYPDMLFEHPFKERSLESFNLPMYSNEGVIGEVVDMEGAGLVEAATFFFQSYQLNFLKIVSDYLEDGVSSQNIEELIENSLETIFNWLESRKKFSVEKELKFTPEEKLVLGKLIGNKFSVTMVNELENILLYYKLLGMDILKILNRYEKLEIKDKRESKKILEDIKNIEVENERE